jgi:succinate-semialdehyde dehydrogenase
MRARTRGSDPFIVLADADLDTAVDAAVTARFQNSGQVCIAAKRFILDRSIADDFTDRLAVAVKRLRIGNPLDESTDIGPMARADLRDELGGQVTASISNGAALLCGGDNAEGPGFFYQPTVLANVRPGTPAFDDETFGPVAALVTANNARHALQLANNSKYGLSASIWTRDVDRARLLAREMEVGGVFVNNIPASDPRIPIGGVKHSGYGRELSHFGVHEFTNAKSIWID